MHGKQINSRGRRISKIWLSAYLRLRFNFLGWIQCIGCLSRCLRISTASKSTRLRCEKFKIMLIISRSSRISKMILFKNSKPTSKDAMTNGLKRERILPLRFSSISRWPLARKRGLVFSPKTNTQNTNIAIPSKKKSKMKFSRILREWKTSKTTLKRMIYDLIYRTHWAKRIIW